MRKSEGSLAVIRRQIEGETRWLALWNVKWDAFHFVGGHRRSLESHRDCLVRELEEELGMKEWVDYWIDSLPLAHLTYTAWSNPARTDTDYTMELYRVSLDEQGERNLAECPAVRWLTDDEIRFERCRDGKPVSPTMGFLIVRASLT